MDYGVRMHEAGDSTSIRATESFCRQSSTITVIHYSGRATELGGIVNLLTDDGPVYHDLSVHLSRAKLTTHFYDRYAAAKFSTSEV